jgi:hypothetical protein
MRRAVLPLVLSALAFLPSAASAALPQPAIGQFDSATVTAALAVAETVSALPQPNVCAGRTTVLLGSQDSAAAAVGRPGIFLGYAPLDGAGRSNCSFHLVGENLAASSDYDVADLCTIMAHEIGHLLGEDDTTIPGDLMNATHSDVQAPECAAAFRRTASRPTPPVAPPTAPAVDDDPTPPAATDTYERPLARPMAPTPRLRQATRTGRRQMVLDLANDEDAQLVVTFYRRGTIMGCADRACREQNAIGLRGRLARRTLRYRSASASMPTVRAPEGWTVATLQLVQPATRSGTITAFSAADVRQAPPPSCEFSIEC